MGAEPFQVRTEDVRKQLRAVYPNLERFGSQWVYSRRKDASSPSASSPRGLFPPFARYGAFFHKRRAVACAQMTTALAKEAFSATACQHVCFVVEGDAGGVGRSVKFFLLHKLFTFLGCKVRQHFRKKCCIPIGRCCIPMVLGVAFVGMQHPIGEEKCDEMVCFRIFRAKIVFQKEKVTKALRAYALHGVLRKIFVTILKYYTLAPSNARENSRNTRETYPKYKGK